jgi:hypothetical protein
MKIYPKRFSAEMEFCRIDPFKVMMSPQILHSLFKWADDVFSGLARFGLPKRLTFYMHTNTNTFYMHAKEFYNIVDSLRL